MRCKDFHIIKIKYYDDKSRPEKGFNNSLIKDIRSRCNHYMEFKTKLIELYSSKTYTEWLSEYSDVISCAFEELDEKIGLKIYQGEGIDVYFIPKEIEYMLGWITSNILIPYKKVLKTNIRFMDFRSSDINLKRNMYRKF